MTSERRSPNRREPSEDFQRADSEIGAPNALRGAAGLSSLRAVKKSNRPEIPRKTIYRLSTYLRCLARLKEKNIQTVSSEALAKVAGVKSTQLRKDLAY